MFLRPRKLEHNEMFSLKACVALQKRTELTIVLTIELV